MGGMCSPSTGRLWGAPLLIIAGSIWVIFDPEYGAAVIVAGVLMTIWLVVRLVKEKREKQALYRSTVGMTLNGDPNYQQQIQNQPIQQPVSQAVSTSKTTDKFCANCGAIDQTTDKFCTNCGSKI